MAELRPEVQIMDVRFPGIDGISAVKRIAEAAPEVKTVRACPCTRLLSDAIAAGARGYVMKAPPPEDLLRAIRTVTAGKLPARSLAVTEPDHVDRSADAPLSEREREILQLLAEGLHTEDVAKRIGLSTETVKSDTKRHPEAGGRFARPRRGGIACDGDDRQAAGPVRAAPLLIVVQILIVVFVLIGAVIAITKLV